MPTRRSRLASLRIAAAVTVSTVVLTAAFVGILAWVSGDLVGLADRLPWYVLGAAVVFVAAVVGLEEGAVDGNMVLLSAAVGALTTLVVLSLAVEGVVYGWRSPERVFVSDLVVYVLAAALLTTGIAYWLLRHWREFAGGPGQRV